MKFKLTDGKEIEIEETDIIKAVKEEYENKIKEKETEITKVKETFAKREEEIRQEHVKQLRAIISGRKDKVDEIPEFEETEKTLEEKMQDNAIKYINQINGIKGDKK